MLNEITLTGEYLGDDITGIIVGGKVFVKNLVQEANVNEDTFKNLLRAVENEWFDIKSHNYNDYLASRGIAADEKIVMTARPAEKENTDEKTDQEDSVKDKEEGKEENTKEEKVENIEEAKVEEKVEEEEKVENIEEAKVEEKVEEAKATKSKKKATKEETPVKED